MIDPKVIDSYELQFTREFHADGVYRDITARLKERSKYEKRWLWELLQNALDSVESEERVDIKIEISDEFISFSHTGNPFEWKDIFGLIIQGTSKDDENKIGRFGTGFMTTYLLSKRVEITGAIAANEGYFQFELDRDANSKEQFRELQKKSNGDFKSSVTGNSYLGETTFQTRFTYKLDDNGKKTAEVGLKHLDELIPITQLFNKQVGNVTVINTGKEKSFIKEPIKSYTKDGYEIDIWKVSTASEQHPRIFNAYILRNERELESCLITENINNLETLLPFSPHIPRLFFTFPLIGTEDLGIPIIINSNNFDLRVERDGVYLIKGSDDSVDVDRNRRIIKDAIIKLLPIYADIFSEKVDQLLGLLDFKKSKDYDWVDHDWLDGVKAEVIELLSHKKIIFVHDSTKKISLNEIAVPTGKAESNHLDLWSLLSNTSRIPVPIEDELFNVIRIVSNISSILRVDVNRLEYTWDLKKILSFVERQGNRISLQACLKIDVGTWLNSLYNIVLQHEGSFSLDYKIILNQNAELRKGEGMSWDKIQDNNLKQISNLVGLNFCNFLVSNDIKPFEIAGVEDYSLYRAIDKLRSRINEFNESDFSNLDLLLANAQFLKWLITNERTDIIKELKVLSGASKRIDEMFSYDYFPKSEHLLLSPKQLFSRDFPLYADLVRDKDCLNDAYIPTLTEDDFVFLEKHNFIHLSPIVVKNEYATMNTLELLCKSEEQITFLRGADGQLKYKFKIQYSDFAYLTSSNGYIYDRNKSQKSSLERLRFFLQEAVYRDELFEKDSQVVSIEELGTTIEISQCLWIYRAKRLNWVNIKIDGDANEGKFVSETPSSKNLSELLKGEDELIKKIRGTEQQLLLHRLGVGVSDLIRNTLKSDELRFSWDKAITSMIISDMGPEVAQAIFNDPGIRAEYEKRVKQRDIIKRNQGIGKLVEKLFKDYIEELVAGGHSIAIEREPWGSDYIISDDSSDLVNDKNEREAIKVDDWLIELKATGKDYAAMTTLQAQTASTAARKDRYALIVLPLDGSEPDIEYIRVNARVVSDIGYKVSPLVDGLGEVQDKKVSLDKGIEGVSVIIEDENIRFRIKSNIWIEQKMTIERFIKSRFQMKVLTEQNLQ